MKLFSFVFSTIITTSLLSCNENNGSVKAEFDTAIVDSLIRNPKKYYEYSKQNFNFNDSAVYLDHKDSIISALDFFECIYIKSYFPVKAKKINQYKLVKVYDWPDKDIYAWVSGEGFWGVGRERLKGRRLLLNPLTDVEGNVIDSNMLNEKHVFVKFWFIACVPCVKEMPDLNKIVDDYRDRKDLLFLSFAADKKEDLLQFLEKKEFKYKVISYYKIPEIDSLKISSFPTHLYVRGNTIQRVIKEKDIRKIIEQL